MLNSAIEPSFLKGGETVVSVSATRLLFTVRQRFLNRFICESQIYDITSQKHQLVLTLCAE